MRVSLEPEALETLSDISEFIDTINTPGACQFWVTDFIFHLYKYAKPNVTYALCQNQIFANEGLSCISNKGWVVAFQINGDEMRVHHIVRGNILA